MVVSDLFLDRSLNLPIFPHQQDITMRLTLRVSRDYEENSIIILSTRRRCRFVLIDSQIIIISHE